MSIERIGRHLLGTRWRLRRIFPPQALARIEQAIKGGSHPFRTGAFRGGRRARRRAAVFAISPRGRALDIFSQLRIWDTVHNNGVLIYLLLADHDFEIVADRGIDARVGPPAGKKSASRWKRSSRPEILKAV